jgi:glucose-6-phosphate dehydrogenase assembly protein OpcA
VTEESSGAGVTGVALELRRGDGSELSFEVSRPDGRLATLNRTGEPTRQLPLSRRALGDLLAEELRRLDADEVYAEALSAATGVTGLSDRPATRQHVWRDPAWQQQAG